MVEWDVFTGAKQTKFSLHFVKATPITNPTKELDTLQQQYDLPFIYSSNARHVVETLKVNAGLDASSSAGMQCTS